MDIKDSNIIGIEAVINKENLRGNLEDIPYIDKSIYQPTEYSDVNKMLFGSDMSSTNSVDTKISVSSKKKKDKNSDSSSDLSSDSKRSKYSLKKERSKKSNRTFTQKNIH